jgi:hypothetical protein|nr:MAG TPA: Protein of unknown function (DUF3848) [Caudoviricetes sp.]
MLNDDSVREKLLSAWDEEYQMMRHNILKYKRERIYALAELICFIETLNDCMQQQHFTDEECAVLLQHSGYIADAVANCMGSTYKLVLDALDEVLDEVLGEDMEE